MEIMVSDLNLRIMDPLFNNVLQFSALKAKVGIFPSWYLSFTIESYQII
jgi:hypothetical protein